MSDNSAIEWTDATWNPIRARNKKTGKTGWHCEHATTGCEFCYSEGFNKRLGTGLAFKPGHRADIDIFLNETMLTQPLRWKKPRMIFVCSMTDLFADFVEDQWIDKMFAVMALCPQHTFQVLTKRAARMREYLTQQKTVGRSDIQNHLAWDTTIEVMRAWYPDWIREDIDGPHRSRAIQAFTKWPLPNVWLGVSTERQQEADERIPLLLDTPAATRFISAEPLLGPIDLTRLCILPQKPGSIRAGIHLNALSGLYCESGMPYLGDWDVTGPCPPATEQRRLDWVIAGGESGSKARPMHPAWPREMRDQCAEAGVPFFFKQWGKWAPYDRSRMDGSKLATPYSTDEPLQRFGKSLAGRLLDGEKHDAMPVCHP